MGVRDDVQRAIVVLEQPTLESEMDRREPAVAQSWRHQKTERSGSSDLVFDVYYGGKESPSRSRRDAATRNHDGTTKEGRKEGDG